MGLVTKSSFLFVCLFVCFHVCLLVCLVDYSFAIYILVCYFIALSPSVAHLAWPESKSMELHMKFSHSSQYLGEDHLIYLPTSNDTLL